MSDARSCGPALRVRGGYVAISGEVCYLVDGADLVTLADGDELLLRGPQGDELAGALRSVAGGMEFVQRAAVAGTPLAWWSGRYARLL